MDTVPIDVLVKIFDCLPLYDGLSSWPRVCRRWYRVVAERPTSYWSDRCKEMLLPRLADSALAVIKRDLRYLFLLHGMYYRDGLFYDAMATAVVTGSPCLPQSLRQWWPHPPPLRVIDSLRTQGITPGHDHANLTPARLFASSIADILQRFSKGNANLAARALATIQAMLPRRCQGPIHSRWGTVLQSQPAVQPRLNPRRPRARMNILRHHRALPETKNDIAVKLVSWSFHLPFDLDIEGLLQARFNAGRYIHHMHVVVISMDKNTTYKLLPNAVVKVTSRVKHRRDYKQAALALIKQQIIDDLQPFSVQ